MFARETDINVSRVLATLVTVVVVSRTDVNPIWLMMLGGLLGVVGVMQ